VCGVDDKEVRKKGCIVWDFEVFRRIWVKRESHLGSSFLYLWEYIKGEDWWRVVCIRLLFGEVECTGKMLLRGLE
jgi:hypothetical protein